MTATTRTPWHSGYDAARLGCLRFLCVRDSEQEYQDWLAGYDAARADMAVGLVEPTGERGVAFGAG